MYERTCFGKKDSKRSLDAVKQECLTEQTLADGTMTVRANGWRRVHGESD